MSEIDYSTLRSLTAHEVCRALERDGFTFTRQRGSHHRYAHPDGRRVTVRLPAVAIPLLLARSGAFLNGKPAGLQMI
jgi:predicted RNA binding protein YcfA (HicA-like mRNA interferase family)